jgi:hypothetical protein
MLHNDNTAANTGCINNLKLQTRITPNLTSVCPWRSVIRLHFYATLPGDCFVRLVVNHIATRGPAMRTQDDGNIYTASRQALRMSYSHVKWDVIPSVDWQSSQCVVFASVLRNQSRRCAYANNRLVINSRRRALDTQHSKPFTPYPKGSWPDGE